MARCLIIGDLHEPACRPNYLQFCKDIYKKYKCNQTVFIGDIVDHHAISFHVKHPSMPSPEKEHELAYQCIQKWHKAFNPAKICLGNHDIRIIRLAESVSIPSKYLRDFSEVWGTKWWTWDYDFVIDDVLYMHGTGTGGSLYPAYNTARKMACSVVMGHHHSSSGIKFLVNKTRRLIAMDVGCGVDDSSLAFAYGRHFAARSVVSCGVVIEGIPYIEICPIGKGEKYYDGDK